MKYIYVVAVLMVLITGCLSEKRNKVELVLDTKSDLGEGSIWNYKTGELIWVNITANILNFYNPGLKNNKEMLTGQMPGTVVPAESGIVIIALKNGIYSLDPSTGAKTLIVDPEYSIPDNRFNDGKCDPAGRFWVGTMNMNGRKGKGSLYRLDPDSSIHRMLENVSVSNGIVWNAAATKMYYVDTPTRQIASFDYDNQTGEIGNRKIAVNVPPEMGAPDGMTIDADDNLWVALWGGSAVGCWNPETGELLRTIEVPAKNVTSCAFGGNDLKTLFITTARQSTSNEDLQKYPYAGGLFKVTPGVRGVKANFFGQ